MNSKRKILKGNLEKRVLLRQFKSSKIKYLYLREWNERDVRFFLKEQGFYFEGEIMKQENIDGICLIALCTRIDKTYEILVDDLGFKKDQISKLVALYKDIYRFRKRFARDFGEDEYPTSTL
eukprot:TRINITY_DN643_c0_g1_i1.p1 TRINITY_DN643_c0_g1~~TRINITY_DN643_c0_g1_i1.p1  ORF type:complete len:122 (-),score=24.38 TRINITY_DN643_c0_g1_i1:153-518(-)